jgi:excisionase family DNA binding protein
METGDRWLSVEEIAAHLSVSKESIYRWLDTQKIPAHRVGRLWRFSKAEVDAWVVRGGAAHDGPGESLKRAEERQP